MGVMRCSRMAVRNGTWIGCVRLSIPSRKRVPSLRVGDAFDCCGLAGSMDYKQGFHKTSLAVGTRLANKINATVPEEVATECLSCQMQFRQMLPYEVSHPPEILREAYRKGRS